MKIIKGDLIKLAVQGKFDVIAHGCNCFNTQKSGLAKQMVTVFRTDLFPLELKYKGDINKLGQIDYQTKWVSNGIVFHQIDPYVHELKDLCPLYVVNCYTQYYHLHNCPPSFKTKAGFLASYVPFSYPAFELCLEKIAHVFSQDKRIGLPMIGCGLGKADPNRVLAMMDAILKNHNLTVVQYDNNKL